MNPREPASAKREQWLDAWISYTLLGLSFVFALSPVVWILSTSLKTEAEALS